MSGVGKAQGGNSGGKRRGAGRPRHVPPLHTYCLCLTEDQVKLLRMWGRGDMSAGLRWLINGARTLVRKKEKSENEG